MAQLIHGTTINGHIAIHAGNMPDHGIATTSYVTTQINNLINAAPEALDTLNELAAALGNNASFSTSVTNSLAGKLSLSGGTMTGKIFSPSFGADAYGGAFEIRERVFAGDTQNDWSYSPAISFHWGNRHVQRFGVRADGLFAIDDAPIALRSWVTSQGYLTSSHNHDDRYYTESESDGRYLRLSGGTLTGDLLSTHPLYPGYNNGAIGSQGSYYLYGNVSNSGIRTNGNFLANGDIYLGTRGQWLSTYLNQNVRTDSAPSFSSVYLGGSQLTGTQVNGLANMLGVTTLPYSVDITVGGDPDRFYAVQFWGGDQDVWRRIIIKRGYGETAPWDPIGTGVHHGGLLLDWEGNFGGWGGAEYADRIRVFNESYTNVCADMFIYSHSMGYVFMLRGGGAVYHIFSDQAINGYYQSGSPDILYNSSTLSYDDNWSGTNVYDVYAPEPLTLAQVNSSRIDGLRTKKQSLLDGRYLRQGVDIGSITNISATNFLASNAFYLNGTTYYLNSANGGIYTNARFESASTIYASGGNSGNWNTAYGWGNHASAGYLTSYTETDPIYVAERNALQLNKTVHPTLLFSTLADYNKPSGYSTMIQPGSYQTPLPSHGYYHIIARRDGAGGYGALLQSYNSHELYHGNTTDSSINISWYKIWNSGDFTSTTISNWNTAYGWGNHAGLYAAAGHSHTFASLTSKPTTISGYGITDAITTGNIGSQSVNYAASAGNADTVDGLHAVSFVRNDTTHQYLKPYFEYSEYLTSQSPQDLVDQMGGGGLRVDFLHPSYTANGSWGHVMTWSGYNGYTMYQLSGSYGSQAEVDLYVRNEADHGKGSWSSWVRLLNSNNYNEYSPTLTGGGASGTWGISVTGSAGSVAWTNVSSRPTALSQFTNDLGNYGGFLTSLPSHNHDDRYYTESESDSRFINSTGDTMSGPLTLASISGTDQTVENTYGAYLHLGGWGIGRTDAAAVLVNTAYRADYATDLFDMNISRFTNNSGYATQTWVQSQGYRTTDSDAQTLSLSGNTLSISGGNSVTISSGGISQATADSLYVNITGDTMTGPLRINGSTSGQELFAVDGVNGRLFSVVDDLSDSLYSVNTIAGLPVLEVFANNIVTIGKFGTNAIYVGQDGRVGFGTTNFSYTASDNSGATGVPSNNRLFVNGSIQLLSNSDGIVFGRGTSTYLKDEDLSFGWGGGWYMEDATYLRVRNGKMLYSPGSARFDDSIFLGGQTYRLYSANAGLYTNGNFGADADIYLGTRSVWLSTYLNQAVRTDSSPTFDQVYANGWFRNNANNTGLYNQTNGNHFYSRGGSIWGITGNGGSVVHLQFRINHESTLRGSVYGDGSGFGLLDSGDNWRVRVDTGGAQVYGSLTVGNTTSSDIYMTDTDETTRRIHTNSGRIGFLNSSSGWSAWSDNTGNWRTDFNMHATYFYGSGSIRVGDMWGGAGLYRPSGSMVFGIEDSDWIFSKSAVTQAYFAGGDGNLWMRWAGDWLSNLLGAKQNASTAITTSNIGSQSVNYAASAGSVAWTNVSSRPTALSQFSNDLGNYGGWITSSGSISGTAARATRANGNFYIDDNYGNTVVGVYTSTRLQGVFAMGDSYKLPADGSSSGGLYGLAWSHPNAGGVAANLNTHGLLVMENGTFLAAISGSIRARDDMRAPALYDSGSRVAISRGEGRNYVDYSRYVYNNGAYSGSGWGEPSDLGVRYANSAGSAGTAGNVTSQVGGVNIELYVRGQHYGGPGENPAYDTGAIGRNTLNMNQTFELGKAGFLDVWGATNATGMPPDCSHVQGVQSMHYLYGYGFQMAGQYDQDRMYVRQMSATSYRAWRLLIDSGNIGSQSVNYAASAGSVAWTNVSGRPTAVSSFTNDAGYLTSVSAHTHDDRYYTETEINNFSYWRNDEARTIKTLYFTGVGGDSGNTSNHSYAIYQGGGGWSHPYPDLHIGYHTGIKLGANTGYGGTRFYSDSDMATELFSVGNGDSHVRVANNLYAGALFDAGSRVAISRGEGRDYVNYSRYVYNNGAYSGTGWIEPSDLGVRYANSAGSASSATSASYAGYLPPKYDGIVAYDPQQYFNYSIGLRVAMTGAWSVWSDTLWINGYTGGDVPWMCALHFLRNSEPRFAISAQRRESSSYGSYYEVITAYNIASQSVSYASTAGNTNSISSSLANSHTWTATNYFRSTGGGYSGSLSSPPLQVYSNSNESAYMSFHKGSYYAVNFGLDTDNVMRIGGWSAATNRWQLDMSGNMTAAGDVTAYSDARVKTNIHTIQNALEKTLALRGVSYNRTDSEDTKTKIGVIAQETLEVLPEVVNQDNSGMYNVSYGNMTALLIEAIKEQQAQIEDLKSEVKKLRGE